MCSPVARFFLRQADILPFQTLLYMAHEHAVSSMCFCRFFAVFWRGVTRSLGPQKTRPTKSKHHFLVTTTNC